MSMLRDFVRDERQRREGGGDEPLIMMRVFVEPILSPDGSVVGGRQLDNEAFAFIAGRGRDRIRQQDNETIDAFQARLEAAALA